MSEHTPAPWTVETVKTSIGHAHKIEPIRACIYVDYRDARQSDERTTIAAADAILIAAAPELLAALKEAVLCLKIEAKMRCPEWDGVSTDYSAIGKAERAIAKAEGRGT